LSYGSEGRNLEDSLVYCSKMGYVNLLSGCACAIVFFYLFSLDALKAKKRKAYWFPGRFLVLSALTLQFINFVNYSPVNVTSVVGNIPHKDVENFLKLQLVIDSGRLVICVFIAYLLPGLVSSRFRRVWIDIGALALNVLVHMYSEISLIVYVYNNFSISVYVWFKVYSAILVIAIILLVLLSICAILAGKTIRVMMNAKVPPLLECCSSSSRKCGNIGDHVLRCWIVVRCSQPEYIMARSVLSSFASLLVTVCFIVFSVKWGCVFHYDFMELNLLQETTFLLQFFFVLIGWIGVSVRWLTAVAYFPIDGGRLFQVEDFWTRSIIDMKYGQLNGPYSLLLSIVSLLQKIIVLISKASCFLSGIILRHSLTILKKIMWPSGLNTSTGDVLNEDYRDYEDLLQTIRMPGEIKEKLWTANESAFKSTKNQMEEGRKSTEELSRIINDPAADEDEETRQEEKNYLKHVGKKSWKMEAVALIHFMLSLDDNSNSDDVDFATKACSQAWALMDFVETSDTEVNLVSLRADHEFRTVKKWINSTQSERLRIRKGLQRNLSSRTSNAKSPGSQYDPQDSMDWITAYANFWLRKTEQVIARSPDNAIGNLRSLLRNVIADCWAEAQTLIIENCNKWAVDGKEEGIYHAAFIAGIAMSLVSLQGNNAVPPSNNAVPPSQGNNAVPPSNNAVPPSQGNNAVPPSQGNNAVPPAAAELEGNNASVGKADGKENDSSGKAEVAHTIVDVEEGNIVSGG